MIDQLGVFSPLTIFAFSSLAGWFRARVPGPETAVWTNRAVMDPPTFRQDLRFFEGVEQPAIQKLRPPLAIKDST